MATESPEGVTVDLVLRCGLLYIVLRIIDTCANFYMASVGHIMGTKIETDMRRDLFGHLQKLSYSYYDNTKILTQDEYYKYKMYTSSVVDMGMSGVISSMLMNMDPDRIGPNMAVALITTYYGSVLANWISAPISTKLGSLNDDEMQLKEIMIEGLLSIQAGENPRVIEEKLKSFLAPGVRDGLSEGGE